VESLFCCLILVPFSYLLSSEAIAVNKEREIAQNVDLLLPCDSGEYDRLRRLIFHCAKASQSMFEFAVFFPNICFLIIVIFLCILFLLIGDFKFADFQDHAKDQFGDFREIFSQIFDVTMFERTMLAITNELLAEGQYHALRKKHELLQCCIPSRV
jgi:hypothetical protein